MTTPTLRLFPHLPLIPMKESLRMLKEAGMPKTVVADILGVSRVQVVRWFSDTVRPTRLSEEALSTLVYQVLRAKKLGRLKTTPQGMAEWSKALEVSEAPFLHDFSLEDLLPTEGVHAAN